MIYSKIDICNLSLAMLGADAIRSFDESNKRSRMCDTLFDITRDFLLAKFDWPFARGRKKIMALESSTLEDEVPESFTAYQLPNDCLTPRDLWPPGSKEAWYIAKNHLYTSNTGDLYLVYTRQILDTNLYSAAFIHLMSLGVAVRIAPSITQDKNLVKSIYDQYNREQFECWETDANVGEDYRMADEDPNNDTFVYPEGSEDPEDESRFLST